MLANTPMVTSAAIRRTIIDTAHLCGESVHIGGSLSMVELLNVLFGGVMAHDPTNPDWDERDMFILSKGHAVLGYLAVLHLHGYFGADKLASFQTNGSDLIAHPIKNIPLGIESSNGSLGQGLAYGLGVAMGMGLRGQNRRVYVLMGDGECNEGSVWESAALAAERGVANLTVMIDQNGFRNDGETRTYAQRLDLAAMWAAFGWHVQEVDGHDEEAIRIGLDACRCVVDGPTALVARTVKGKGVAFMEANNDWHHNRITKTIYEDCLRALGERHG